MKSPKEIDVLARAVWFEDTPAVIEDMKAMDFPKWARHLHKMNIYHKNLIAEIRKLRRQLKKGETG